MEPQMLKKIQPQGGPAKYSDPKGVEYSSPNTGAQYSAPTATAPSTTPTRSTASTTTTTSTSPVGEILCDTSILVYCGNVQYDKGDDANSQYWPS